MEEMIVTMLVVFVVVILWITPRRASTAAGGDVKADGLYRDLAQWLEWHPDAKDVCQRQRLRVKFSFVDDGTICWGDIRDVGRVRLNDDAGDGAAVAVMIAIPCGAVFTLVQTDGGWYCVQILHVELPAIRLPLGCLKLSEAKLVYPLPPDEGSF